MSPPSGISFEFFPPKTPEGEAKLRVVRRELAAFAPEFYSVTFGAGGSTREGTLRTITEMHAETVPAAPHLSCVGATTEEMRSALHGYRALGVRRLVALRGDLPSGSGGSLGGDFHYARDLVAFVRAETGDWFHVEVGAYPETHPQATSPLSDVTNLVTKFEGWRGLGHHAVFLQCRRVLPVARRSPGGGRRRAHRAGHHADHQLHPARPLLRRMRRRDPPVDAPEARRVRRRRRVDQGFRSRRRDRALRTAVGARRTGTALLHAQSGRRGQRDPATSGSLTKTAALRAPSVDHQVFVRKAESLNR